MHIYKSTFSLIVPFFNEEKVIANSYKRLSLYLKKNIPNFELIFINDGSTDSSYKIIKKSILGDKNCRLITYPYNKGRGFAIREGFKRVRGNVVGYIDSDLEIGPEYIASCFKEIEKYDCVIVSKHHKLSRVKSPLVRKVASLIFSYWVRFVLNLKVSDTQAGLKLFKKEKLNKILKDVKSDGWLADIEILYFFSKNNFSVKEIPINISFGRGKIRKSFIIDFLKSFIMVWQIKNR